MAQQPYRHSIASAPEVYPNAPRAGGLAAAVPWHLMPLVALIYTWLIFAPEAAVNLSGVNMTAYRAAILALLLPSILSFTKGGSKVLFPDIAVGISALWMIIAFINLFDPLEGLVRSLGIVVDALGGYLIARTSIRSHNDFRRLLILVAPGFFAAGAILAIESLSHTIIYRSAFANIFGSGSVYVEGNAAGAIVYRTDSRLGLLRAYSTFSHPILAGVTLASLLPLYFMSGLRSWPLWFGLSAALLSFFSVSSVTILMISLCVVMLLIDRYKGLIRSGTWPIITAGLAFLLFVIHVTSKSGVIYVLIRFTFSPHNGYVRIIQWDAALEAMANSPWFGQGYKPVAQLPAWLPPSIDAHFLSTALRSGWITTIGIYLAGIWILFYLGLKLNRFPARERNLIVGLNFAIALLLIASFTVTFFGETNVYFMSILGIGAAFCQLPQLRNSSVSTPIRTMPQR